MDYLLILKYIYDKKISITVQCILTILTYIVIRYRYKQPESYLVLKKKTKEKLLREYEPEPIILERIVPYEFKKIKYNFSNHDVFNLGKKYKNEIKNTIREYGIGTCGPRGFYGTLDLHIELEDRLAKIFNKEASIIYSNYFTCAQSVISCFCRSTNNVFINTEISECIRSGARLSRANIFTYDNLDNLELLLKQNIKDKYVIVEMVGKNTGELLDLKKIVEFKKLYGFRIILDVTYSMPFISQEPEDLDLYQEIDLIIGSLSLGYPTNGGFCATCKNAVDYQRLSGSSYVFSASLPAFLTKATLCALSDKINYEKIKQKIKIARNAIPGIVSTEKSPIFLIENNKIEEKLEKIREEGYVVGRNGKYLRVCINEDADEKDIKKIGEILLK